MFDYRQDRSTIPLSYPRAFYQEGTIPLNTFVWIAKNVPFNEGQASGATHTMGRGDDNPDLYLVTFRVDQLVVQVLMGIAQDVRPNRPRHGDAAVQIWPQTLSTVAWTPSRVLDEFEYAAFTEAFVRDYMRG